MCGLGYLDWVVLVVELVCYWVVVSEEFVVVLML